jgi:phosphosulfolactate synthase (CoM biosynthesis protein A)
MVKQHAVPDRALDFLRVNDRGAKPRSRGLTEIRGPYYTAYGRRHLEDVLETMGAYVDILKFAGGGFVLMPTQAVKGMIDLCHAHDVLVSTGGFLEYVLGQGPEAVRHSIDRCKELGFDIVEVSSGFLSVPTDDLLHLVERVRKAGLKAKPEVGIQFGAGGATAEAELRSAGTHDPQWAIIQARRFLDAGAQLIMIESEGITENVSAWRTDAVAAIADALGLERVMFEAADPAVFAWYVKCSGPEVNLFVDHSQIVQIIKSILLSGSLPAPIPRRRRGSHADNRGETRAKGRPRYPRMGMRGRFLFPAPGSLRPRPLLPRRPPAHHRPAARPGTPPGSCRRPPRRRARRPAWRGPGIHRPRPGPGRPFRQGVSGQARLAHAGGEAGLEERGRGLLGGHSSRLVTPGRGPRRRRGRNFPPGGPSGTLR